MKQWTLCFLAMSCFGLQAAEPVQVAAAPAVPEQAALPLPGPVHWRSWGAEVQRQAQQTGRPIYVFAGSRLSELTRTTWSQCFSNTETAAYYDGHFVCVYVDLDEQANLGAVLRHLAGVVRQADGVPLHFWFSPDMRLIEVHGYQPANEEWGKPGLSKLGMQVSEIWAQDPAGSGSKIAETLALSETSPERAPEGLKAEGELQAALDAAVARRAAQADRLHFGYGEAPKHPQPELLRFLMRRGGEEGGFARNTLRRLACSALRDPLDGGFFRYSADAAWRLPSQQKRLSDQARLSMAFLEADAAEHDEVLREAGFGALDYALARLASRAGDFVNAEDGTEEGRGACYQWKAEELRGTLGVSAQAFFEAHGVQEAGNLGEEQDPGHRYKGVNFLVSRLPLQPEQRESLLKIAALRGSRKAPTLDGRRFLGANALMLQALSRASAHGGGAPYRKAAERLYAALRAYQTVGDEASYVHLLGSTEPATPADIAALVCGLKAYAEVVGSDEAGRLASLLSERLLANAFDADRRRFLSPAPAGAAGALSCHAPVVAEPLHAEALLLMAGASGPSAASLREGILESLGLDAEGDIGDLLLALSLSPRP